MIMNADHERLPPQRAFLAEMPLSLSQSEFIAQSRQQICEILNNQNPRLLLITGPCSIHDLHATMEYATRLRRLAQSISDSFLVIMRVYFEKPRTTIGWKGFVSDPYLDGSNKIEEGLRMTRKLLLDLADLQIPTAAEFLDPFSAYYLEDLISWGCIGARTTESQLHRQLASALPMPVGFKNNTNGNAKPAINGILAASRPHSYIGVNSNGNLATIHSKGNDQCHLVLRGGETKPNYDPDSIAKALSSLKKASLPQRLIIDCSHDNSRRKQELQPTVFQSVIHQILEGNTQIRGLMLESHLHAGSQNIPAYPAQLQYGVSITDPCLSWEITERLVQWGANVLSKKHIPTSVEEMSLVHCTEVEICAAQ